MAFVPMAIPIMVTRLGLHYRFQYLPGRTPIFNVTLVLLPLVFIVSALIALPALLLPPFIIEFVQSIPSLLPLPVGVSIFEPIWSSTLLTLPLALFMGILGAILGSTFGDFWHSNNRKQSR
jgi:hypothetical protein